MSRYAMIINALTAASYIFIGTFDSLVTFIGKLPYLKIYGTLLSLSRFIRIRLLFPSCTWHVHSPQS